MQFNIALVIDPDWVLKYPQVNNWQLPNWKQEPRPQWFISIRQQLSGISQQPADLILTPDLDGIPWDALFEEQQPPQYNQQYQWPHQLIPTTQHHPSKHVWNRIKRFKIMSRAFTTNTTKKNPIAQPIPNVVPIATQYGLINANAHNDAIERMLTQTKYNIHHLVIIDPYHRINTGGARLTAPSNYNSVSYETWFAEHFCRNRYPHIPLTIIS